MEFINIAQSINAGIDGGSLELLLIFLTGNIFNRGYNCWYKSFHKVQEISDYTNHHLTDSQRNCWRRLACFLGATDERDFWNFVEILPKSFDCCIVESMKAILDDFILLYILNIFFIRKFFSHPYFDSLLNISPIARKFRACWFNFELGKDLRIY